MKLFISILFFFIIYEGSEAQQVFIPSAGNSWAINDNPGRNRVITQTGIRNWSNPETRIRTYFHTQNPGSLELYMVAKVASGNTVISVAFENQGRTVSLQNVTFDTIHIGNYRIANRGYHNVEITGKNKEGEYFAEVLGFMVKGDAAAGKVTIVRDDFHFGRRGPSVHLRYDLPGEKKDIVWFYNEITVPEGEDIPGSYFMANGFADGYFGIQVNSTTERRILFSVWSPYKTDNPGEIPEKYRITLLKKGNDVVTGEFGNEGSGGQSFRRYYWKAGNTYRFLLKGVPSVNGATDYTAWFFAPELGKWELIASFRRPESGYYLKSLYSFLENFIPETGYIPRKGYFSNQWIMDIDNNWYELTSAKFTADATARKGARLDYAGGAEKENFYLKNCGFFDETTRMDQTFTREPAGKKPVIDGLPE